MERLREQRPEAVDNLVRAGWIPGAAQLWGRVPANSGVIEGVVNAALEAVLRLLIRDTSGRMREIEAVVDTGYTGFLTLPLALVADLELPYFTSGTAFLADGTEVRFNRQG